MRRTTSLTSAAVLGLTAPLLALTTTAADAAPATCGGRPATIVGSGHTVTGTEGPDVVVTNGADTVRTLGGDDVVCITGRARGYSVEVDAGAGDDVVDGSTAPTQAAYVQLGAGTDTYTGGDEDDRVVLTYPDPGSGVDVVHGGGGSDMLTMQTGPGAAYVDNAAGQFLSAGELRTTWTGLEQFWFRSVPAARDLTFVGTDADEAVYDSAIVASRTDVDLGGGDDAYYGQTAPALGSRFQGGGGRDRLWVASMLGELHLDLEDGLLDRGPASEWEVPAHDFEDADLFARRVTLTGTNGPNVLGVQACNAQVRGRSGDDVIERRFEGVFEYFTIDCREHMTANGGSGDDEISGTGGADKLLGGKGRDRLNGMHGSDRLVGGRGHDHLRGKDQGDTLLGGRGNDYADGGKGRRDVCRAEHERRCEH